MLFYALPSLKLDFPQEFFQLIFAVSTKKVSRFETRAKGQRFFKILGSTLDLRDFLYSNGLWSRLYLEKNLRKNYAL